ncbi:MAG: ABC transporter permease [Chlamydiae bacterium]|nr:ABC transporter permease [Chlamydiota bacterium]
MSLRRIWAILLRYFYFFTKPDQMAEVFYYPAVDIVLWGMTSIWIQSQQTAVPNIALTILTGLAFWQVIWRGTYEIAVNLLQEYWCRNLTNLFATSLKISEWMVATIVCGIFKISIGILVGAMVVWLLYALNIFAMGWAFLPFVASLMMSAWFIGFLTASILIYFGQRLQMFAWLMPFVFAPFSAVFYPLAVLPGWMQAIAKMLPTTYIFEAMRKLLFTQELSYEMLLKSFILNIFYITLSMILLKVMFEKSRVKGLGRLE